MPRPANIHAAIFIQSRLQKKLSQARLSKLTGIQRSTINKIEKGERLPSELSKNLICKFMDKTYAEMKIEFIESLH